MTKRTSAVFSVEGSETGGEIPPALAQAIEETVLFGRVEAFDALLARLDTQPDIPDTLRYGLESLRYFRSHYAGEVERLSEADRQRVIRLDADWTMQLIQHAHRRHFGLPDDRLA